MKATLKGLVYSYIAFCYLVRPRSVNISVKPGIFFSYLEEELIWGKGDVERETGRSGRRETAIENNNFKKK